jgi:hypothetical protein
VHLPAESCDAAALIAQWRGAAVKFNSEKWRPAEPEDELRALARCTAARKSQNYLGSAVAWRHHVMASSRHGVITAWRHHVTAA